VTHPTSCMDRLSESESPVSTSLPYEWTRHCPQCGRWLHKASPQEPWVCECGWVRG